MNKGGYVYMMTNRRRTVVYTGVTSELSQRLQQHRDGSGSSFARKYKTTDLVYVEEFPDIEQAIAREKQIKAGSRRKKNELIERENPLWRDLSQEIR